MPFFLFLFELIFLFFLSRFVARSLSHLFFRITKSQKATVHLLALLFFPGVVVHELAHMLVASILFVPVGHIEFIPQIIKGGVKLGSVEIAKTDPVRRMLIGFAPVFVGIILLFLLLYVLIEKTLLLSIIVEPQLQIVFYAFSLYVLFVVSNTMFSSKKDMEGTIELLLVVAIIILVLYLLGIRVDFSFFEKFLLFEDTFLQKAALFLSLPIVIDIGIWGIVKLIIRR